MSHTPGPWCTMYSYAVIRGFDGTDVANIILKSDNKQDNARLIAAAPDLLIALQMCREELAEALRVSDSNQQADNIDACMVAADSAIAKATGETK